MVHLSFLGGGLVVVARKVFGMEEWKFAAVAASSLVAFSLTASLVLLWAIWPKVGGDQSQPTIDGILPVAQQPENDPAVKVDVRSIMDEWKTNPVGSQMRYRSAQVLMEGIYSDYSTNIHGQAFIHLAPDDGKPVSRFGSGMPMLYATRPAVIEQLAKCQLKKRVRVVAILDSPREHPCGTLLFIEPLP